MHLRHYRSVQDYCHIEVDTSIVEQLAETVLTGKMMHTSVYE